MLTFRFLWKFKFLFWSKLSILLQVWKAETLDCGGSIPVSQQSSRNSIEVEVDISIFLDYSVLYWHMEKHLFDSVAVASFNLHFFCYIIFYDFDCGLCPFFSSSYSQLCLASWAYWDRLVMLPEMPILNFSSKFTHGPLKYLDWTQILGVWNFWQVMMNQNLCKNNRSCFKLALLWS